jgi:hypothetical protein
MPPLVWRRNHGVVMQGYEVRHPGKGTTMMPLVAWACWSVDGLHYLDDIDCAHTGTRSPVLGHSPDIVDIANVRWATSTAITAIDFCAAALERAFCSAGPREADLRDFEPLGPKQQSNRARLPTPVLNWVDNVLRDQRYLDIHEARNAFTHSWLNRNIKVGGPSGAAGRTEFMVRRTAHQMNARTLIEIARDLATDQISDFLDVFDKL